MFDAALAAQRETGDIWFEAVTECIVAAVHLLRGDVDQVELWLGRGLPKLRQIGDERSHAVFSSFRAHARYAAGDKKAARGEIAHSVDRLRVSGDVRSTIIQGSTPECAEHAEKYAAMQESLRRSLSRYDHSLVVDELGAAPHAGRGGRPHGREGLRGELGCDPPRSRRELRAGDEARTPRSAPVRVLRRAGNDAASGADFFVRTLDDDARAACDLTLGRGAIPPFGGFAFLHPTTCWRVFQAKAFARELDSSCGQSAGL